MNYCIIDDEPIAHRIIEGFCEHLLHLKKVGNCYDAFEALQLIRQTKVDLIFLDINMPEISGLTFYKSLIRKPRVIFTTAYAEHAVEGFNLDAVDYLLKPISFDRFYKSCNRVIDHLNSNKESSKKSLDTILIKENKRLYKVASKEIKYVKAFGDYIRIFTTNKTYISKDRLQRFATELPDFFVQVHRSFIININHVEYLEGNHVVIQEEKIPVSDRYKSKLIELL